jgi:sugar lactone lactonase YvrE
MRGQQDLVMLRTSTRPPRFGWLPVGAIALVMLAIAASWGLGACGGGKQATSRSEPSNSVSTASGRREPSPEGGRPAVAPGMMITAVGGGLRLGDAGPATAAGLCAAGDVAVDAAGNLYIADYGVDCNGPGGNTVRRVDAKGIITTVAGSAGALPGFAGDGGPATSARLNMPLGVAVDAAGNLYISDRDNARIRKVDPHGTIATFAGTGKPGYSGDGGPARSAQLTAPGGLAVDSKGNLYVADFGVVRKINGAGIINTVAGTGKGFGRYGSDVEPPVRFSGNGGPATKATLNPNDVTLDARDHLYISDGNWVHRVGRDGIIRRVAGAASANATRLGDGGPATAAALSTAGGITFDSRGNLLIAEYRGERVRKVDPHGTITTIAGTGDPGLSGDRGRATELTLSEPSGVAVDRHDLLYIADTHSGRVRAVRYDDS